MWKKKKIITDSVSKDIPVEIQEVEVIEEVVEEIVEIKQIKKCDGMVKVRVTDQFVKFNGLHKRWDTLSIPKEIAQEAKWCKVL